MFVIAMLRITVQDANHFLLYLRQLFILLTILMLPTMLTANSDSNYSNLVVRPFSFD